MPLIAVTSLTDLQGGKKSVGTDTAEYKKGHHPRVGRAAYDGVMKGSMGLRSHRAFRLLIIRIVHPNRSCITPLFVIYRQLKN